jgi:hypothetical protein
LGISFNEILTYEIIFRELGIISCDRAAFPQLNAGGIITDGIMGNGIGETPVDSNTGMKIPDDLIAVDNTVKGIS